MPYLTDELVCLEGSPFIIRFKTFPCTKASSSYITYGLEGSPFIIRFKTKFMEDEAFRRKGLEGSPFIIRFKTAFLNSF